MLDISQNISLGYIQVSRKCKIWTVGQCVLAVGLCRLEVVNVFELVSKF